MRLRKAAGAPLALIPALLLAAAGASAQPVPPTDPAAPPGGAAPQPAETNPDGTTPPAPPTTTEAPPPPPAPPVQAPAVVPSVAPVVAAPPPPVKTIDNEPPSVRIGDFMDTRLTWVMGDDDVLHQTGQAQPLSPDFSIGDRRTYRLFFDNLNSRFAGRENLTHLALYKKMPGFIKGLDTEASMVLRFDLASLARATNNLNQSLYDAGSFIRAFYHTDGDKNGKRGLSVTLWPLDTDRFRLGYLYDISWGGTNPFINQSIFPRVQGGAPGGKVEYNGGNWSVFFGLKTATIVQVEQTLTPGTSEVEEIRIGQTNYGLLGGGSVDVNDYLHIDLGGGYFQQGKFDLPDVAGQSIYTLGASARLLIHDKSTPVPQSIDFALYRNDPNKPMIIFKPEVYTPGKTTWSVALEGTNLWQRVKDFDVAGGTTFQQARAAAVQANVKSGFLRGSFTAIYRDLPYVLRNQPSYIPFQSLPNDAATANEFFLAVASDYYLPAPRLTFGLGAGLQFPSTFSTSSVDQSDAPISRTVVVREQGNIAILPVNQGAVPIFQARASLKWDLSTIMSALLWLQYVRDNNGTFVERDPSEGTLALRSFISPNFFGFGASVSARFRASEGHAVSPRLSLHLDRRDAVHRPGELITGRVEIVCPESRRCDELVASLDWDVESRGEPYAVRGAPIVLAAGLALAAGEPTTVPFEIPAPSGPLTYHGHILTVSWTLRVEAKLGWASRERVEARILLLPWTEEARALTAKSYRTAPARHALVYNAGPLPEVTLDKRDEPKTLEHPIVGVALAAASAALLVLRAGAFARILALLLLVGGLSALFAHLRRRTLRERLGPPELAVHPEIVRAGETVTVSVSFKPGRPEVLKELIFSLSAQEVVVRPSSEPDEPRHYRHSLHGERRPVVDRARLRLPPGHVTVVQESFQIPLRAPPSFGAPNNELRWEVSATVRTADLVSWKQTQRILVHPPAP